MPAPLWPATLPQLFNATGFYFEPLDVRSIAATDGGVDRMAVRNTPRIDRFGGTMPMSEAQCGELDDFFFATLGKGVLDFDFPRAMPTIGDALWRVRFDQPHRLAPDRARPGLWIATLVLTRFR